MVIKVQIFYFFKTRDSLYGLLELKLEDTLYTQCSVVYSTVVILLKYLSLCRKVLGLFVFILL